LIINKTDLAADGGRLVAVMDATPSACAGRDPMCSQYEDARRRAGDRVIHQKRADWASDIPVCPKYA